MYQLELELDTFSEPSPWTKGKTVYSTTANLVLYKNGLLEGHLRIHKCQDYDTYDNSRNAVRSHPVIRVLNHYLEQTNAQGNQPG